MDTTIKLVQTQNFTECEFFIFFIPEGFKEKAQDLVVCRGEGGSCLGGGL